MYSTEWFDTFAATTASDAEVSAICRLAPPADYPRLLDLGCGIGRIDGLLCERGYDVTGIDTSRYALLQARQRAPHARFIAIDQTHVGSLRATFDVVIVIWNSIGFGSRQDDRDVLHGIHLLLRPGGRLLLDLYHPGWLAVHEQTGFVDPRGAVTDRWLEDGRCHHRIRYPGGSADDIQFNVYPPDEMRRLVQDTGFRCLDTMVWWASEAAPSADNARYQLSCVRP